MHKHQGNLILDHSDNTLDPQHIYLRLFIVLQTLLEVQSSIVELLCCTPGWEGGRQGRKEGGGNQESDCSGEHRYGGVRRNVHLQTERRSKGSAAQRLGCCQKPQGHCRTCKSQTTPNYRPRYKPCSQLQAWKRDCVPEQWGGKP